jgi:ketosteroid isomerase-like protein
LAGRPIAALVAFLLAAGPEAPLLRADEALDAAVAARDREAFLSLLEPDAVFTGATLLAGRDAVWGRWSRFFEPGGPTLRWHPTAGGVAGSGDLGWTVGEATFAWKEKGIAPSPGRYLTVWRKDAGGRWVAALDGSLEPVSPAPSRRKEVRTLVSRDGSLEGSIGTWERGEGAARTTGIFLLVRERRDGAWRTVQESEIPDPPPKR